MRKCSKNSSYSQSMVYRNKSRIGFIGVYGEGFGSAAVTHHVKIMDKTHWNDNLGKLYFNHEPVQSNPQAYSLLKEGFPEDRLIVENFPANKTREVRQFYKGKESGRIDLNHGTYNKLVFNVLSSGPAFFVLSYPFSFHWVAELDGEKVPIYRANGVEQTVWLPKGKHTVEFRYTSWAAFWGMMIR